MLVRGLPFTALYIILKPAVVKMQRSAAEQQLSVQVETDPIPHLVFDVRSPDAVKEKPLPKELSVTALHLPLEEVEGALTGTEKAFAASLCILLG